MKLTPWFPADVKPVHIGVYMTCFWTSSGDDQGYSHWNGKEWGWEHITIKQANRYKSGRGASQFKRWRGLAEPPKKAAVK